MFDVNTIETYRTFFAKEAVFERKGIRMAWTGMADPDVEPGSVVEAVFSAEPVEGSNAPVVAPHTHRERHFPEAEVLTALEKIGLDCLDVYGHHEDAVLKQPLDEQVHTKAIYMARGRAIPF